MTKNELDKPDPNVIVHDFAELKRKSLTGIGSLLGRQFFVYGIMFAGNIILARILLPQTFGIYAIVTFIVQFFSTFSDVGIGAALIQKKEELNNEELSTLFWLQQMLAFAVVLTVFITAPLAMRIYPALPPVTVWLIRGMAITFLFTSFKTVPAILMERALDFQRIAVVDIAEVVVFQVAAIAFALAGFDVWSFIIAALLKGVLGAGLIYRLSSWRPSFEYRLSSVRELIHFGIPYQGNTILSFIKDAVTPLFVGAYAGAAAVGYVNWARNFAFAPLVLPNSFGRVAFPAFSRIQHERLLLKDTIERSIRMITLIMFPITAIMLSLGHGLIRLVYTEKWLPAIWAFYLYCTSPAGIGIFLPLGSAIVALGQARTLIVLTLGLIIFEWGLGVPFVIQYGFVGVAMTQPITATLFSYLYLRVLRRNGVDVCVLKNVLWQLSAAILCGAVAAVLYYFVFPNNDTLLVLAIGGSAIAALGLYYGFLRVFQNSLLREFNSYLSGIFDRGAHERN
jgi:PST family polysaccharide transporter